MNLWDFAVKKVRVKFLVDVPEFVGIDLREYGPFSKGEIAEIPEENANVLIERKVVEVVE